MYINHHKIIRQIKDIAIRSPFLNGCQAKTWYRRMC